MSFCLVRGNCAITEINAEKLRKLESLKKIFRIDIMKNNNMRSFRNIQLMQRKLQPVNLRISEY